MEELKKQKFVLHTLTGQEGKAEKSIKARIVQEEMGAYIGEVHVPTEKITDVKDSKRRTVTKRIFPGYIFVEAALYDYSGKKRKIIEATYHFLRETPGILFGGEKQALPEPLTDEEWDSVINQSMNADVPKPRVEFKPGEMVSIVDGPFMSYDGVVEEFEEKTGKLKVTISIFGRSAPVELESWQVTKFEEKPQNESSPSNDSLI